MATPYMFQRRAGWYVRVRNPPDLRALLGTHLARTLRTGDKSVARARALGIVASLHEVWADLRTGLLGQIDALKAGQATADDILAYLRANPGELSSLSEKAQSAISAWLDTRLNRAKDDVLALHRQRDRLQTLQVLLDDARSQGVKAGLLEAMRATPAPTYVSQPRHQEVQGRPDPWPSLVDEFLADNPGIGAKTINSYRITFSQFESLVGPKPIRDMTKADLKTYADWLRDKPSSRGGTLGRSTIVRHLSEVKFFLKWAVSNGFVEDRQFSDIQARRETADERRARPEDSRRAFKSDELQCLFDTPLFVGFKSRSERSKPGPRREKLTDFWFFLALAMTGARVGELAIAPATLYDLGGILCLDLRDAGRKTNNSPRLIPILPELRRSGFVDYASEQALAGRALMQPIGGDITAAGWSKRLNRYLDDVGFSDAALVAYSLRHSFRQMLRASGINHEIVNKVFGHETGDVGQGYGRDMSPDEARQVVERVKFPVPLDHLYIS